MTEQEWHDNVYLSRLDRLERDGVSDGQNPDARPHWALVYAGAVMLTCLGVFATFVIAVWEAFA